MKFRFNLQLEVLLLAAAAQIVAGQFTITYFNSQRCIGLQLNCRNYRYFQCCDAPPTWENFYGIRVTSGGTFGLVVFSYPTRYGGCGACQYGGLLSRCYENFRPFNTAYVVPVQQCRLAPNKTDGQQVLEGVMPEQEQERPYMDVDPDPLGRSACTSGGPPTILGVNGEEFDISGPDYVRIATDAGTMPLEAFLAKWLEVLRARRSNSNQAAAIDGPPKKPETSPK